MELPAITRLPRIAHLLFAGVIDKRAAARALHPRARWVVGRERQIVFLDECEERQALGCPISEMKRVWEGPWSGLPDLSIRPAVYRDPDGFHYPAVEQSPWDVPRVGAPQPSWREAAAAAGCWAQQMKNQSGIDPREEP